MPSAFSAGGVLRDILSGEVPLLLRHTGASVAQLFEKIGKELGVPSCG